MFSIPSHKDDYSKAEEAKETYAAPYSALLYAGCGLLYGLALSNSSKNVVPVKEKEHGEQE